MVLPLNYLLTASLGTMTTVAQTKESLRMALNWVTASHLQEQKKGEVLNVGMGMRCLPCSVGARTISGPNDLHSKLRATIHLKKGKKEAVAVRRD